MLLLNTTSCNGTDLFWPFLFWLLGAFLLGLLIPWILRLIGGGGADDWKSKYEGLDAKYNALHNSNAKLEKDLEAIKSGGKSYGKGKSSKDKTDWKSKFEDINKKFKDLDNKHTNLQKDYEGLKKDGSSKDKDGSSKDSEDWKSKFNELDTRFKELESKHDDLSKNIEKTKDSKSSDGDTDWKAKYEKLEAEQKESVTFSSGPNLDDGKRDDLTKVEGIGPKIQEHLNNGGIYTFDHLSKADVKYLRKILDDAGPAYKVHQPGTWPDQAKMADEGRWDELKKWQNELLGGK